MALGISIFCIFPYLTSVDLLNQSVASSSDQCKSSSSNTRNRIPLQIETKRIIIIINEIKNKNQHHPPVLVLTCAKQTYKIALAVCYVVLCCHRDTSDPANSTKYCRYQVQIVTKRLKSAVHMKTPHRIHPADYRFLYIVYYFLGQLVSIQGSVKHSTLDQRRKIVIFVRMLTIPQKNYRIFRNIFFRVL